MTVADVEVNGRQPDIVGQACERLVAIEYRHAGDLVEPANVIFLRFCDRWHRLYFDFATVFWREDTSGPKGFVADELDATFQPVDLGQTLGVQGQVLVGVAYVRLSAGAAVHLRFAGGQLVRFQCENDITRYSA